MVDIFNEVDEQLRAERFRALLKQIIPVFIAALVLSVLTVLGIWGWSKYQTQRSSGASEAYSKGMDSLQKNDADAAFAAFEQAAKGPAGYKALALMQEAGIRLQQNKPDQAVSLFDAAAKAAPDQMIGDLASLKAAYVLTDTAPLATVAARLTPLMQSGRPYQPEAREAIAIAEVAAGQTAAARKDLGIVQLLSDTPDPLRERAGALIAVIDSGTAGQLPNLIRESLHAPPIPPPQDASALSPGPQTGSPQ